MNREPLLCRGAAGTQRSWIGRVVAAIVLLLLSWQALAADVAILCYHRFGPTVADSMTTRTAVFEQQLARLKQEGYTIIPLTEALAGLRGEQTLPAKPVVLTVDDGHRTVYTELLPIIRREHLPVTLFIYASAISNASYAMTWDQLRELIAEPGVTVQSHTYWHPNFKVEKKRLSADDYARLVQVQLVKSRQTLKNRLGVDTPLLAWPFGIHDAELQQQASAAGYTAAFALENRMATAQDSPMALPRFLIVDASGVNGFANMLRGASQHPSSSADKKPQ